MYDVEFTTEADLSVAKWQKSDPAKKKKLDKVLKAIAENPRDGIGKPEPLKGGRGVVWSRHITHHDRVIYNIYDDKVLVLIVEVEGHYNDK